LSDFIDNLWRREICPSVNVPDGVDIAAYCKALRERYHNPSIVHHTAQIANDTSKKLPPRILGPLTDNLKAGRPISSLCLILAGWMFFVKSEFMSGHIINDPQVDKFIPIIEDSPDSDSYVTAMLEIDSIFNADLIRHVVVVKTIKNWYRQIEADGIDACLRIAAKEV
jgi:fructuronate reductase